MKILRLMIGLVGLLILSGCVVPRYGGYGSPPPQQRQTQVCYSTEQYGGYGYGDAYDDAYGQGGYGHGGGSYCGTTHTPTYAPPVNRVRVYRQSSACSYGQYCGPECRTRRKIPGRCQHLVCRGETLSCIARRYGISVHALMAANGIRCKNCIFAGEYLSIP